MAWLWLWCRPAATAPIGPLAWERLYAVGVALERQKKKKKKKRKKRKKKHPPKLQNLVKYKKITYDKHDTHLYSHTLVFSSDPPGISMLYLFLHPQLFHYVDKILRMAFLCIPI